MTGFLLSYLLVFAAPSADQPAKPRLAVMDTEIKGGELDAIVGQSLSAVVAAQALLLGGERFDVVSRNEIRAQIKQMSARQGAGGDIVSGADVAKLLEAEFLLTTSVNQVGGEWVFTVELTQASTGNVISRGVGRYKGPTAGLVDLVRPYVTTIFEAKEASSYRGMLDVLVTENETEILVDDVNLGLSPVNRKGDLTIGTHRVHALKNGFVPFEMDVVINRDETSVLSIELVDLDSIRPWYRKWWVWTAVGAVAVAATTTAVLLNNGETPAITLSKHPIGN